MLQIISQPFGYEKQFAKVIPKNAGTKIDSTLEQSNKIWVNSGLGLRNADCCG